MRLLPRSLRGRLLVTASAALVVALAFAGVSIGHVLERFVTQNLDERLDAQIAVVARAVRPDGSIDPRAAIDLPPFNRPGSGWTWRIDAPGGTIASRSAIAPPPLRQERGDRHRPGDRIGPDDRGHAGPRPFEARAVDGDRVHGRALVIPTPRGDATISATGPRDVVERPLHEAIVPLATSLLLLGAGLALAIFVQLRLGLKPLNKVAAMLAEVRDGRRERIDVDEPTELRPMLTELNALIDANRLALERARGHTANLAHGLKTPLAALRLDIAAAGLDDSPIAAHAARIEGQVRHHLGRARAASLAAASSASVPLAAVVTDLVAALARIHADRDVAARMSVPDELHVRADRQDAEEALGNLIDNAWRHARARVTVDAAATAGTVRIVIADDGPGIPSDRLAQVAQPGQRLDERGDGHGFGIPIARELVELAGGTLTIRNGDVGLQVVVELPQARMH